MTGISHRHTPARKRWREKALAQSRVGKRLRVLRQPANVVVQPRPQNDVVLAILERELDAVNALIGKLYFQLSIHEKEREKLCRRIRLHERDTAR